MTNEEKKKELHREYTEWVEGLQKKYGFKVEEKSSDGAFGKYFRVKYYSVYKKSGNMASQVSKTFNEQQAKEIVDAMAKNDYEVLIGNATLYYEQSSWADSITIPDFISDKYYKMKNGGILNKEYSFKELFK